MSDKDDVDCLVMRDVPEGATHIDNGPSKTKWLRINDALHDYWCEAQMRWITFEGGHNQLRQHWAQFST